MNKNYRPELEKMIKNITNRVAQNLYLSCLLYLSCDTDNKKYSIENFEDLTITLGNLVYECDRYYGSDNTLPEMFKYADVKINPIKFTETSKIVDILKDNYKAIVRWVNDYDMDELKNVKGEWLAYLNIDGLTEEFENIKTQNHPQRMVPKITNGLKIGKSINLPLEKQKELIKNIEKGNLGSVATLLENYKAELESGADGINARVGIQYLKNGYFQIPGNKYDGYFIEKNKASEYYSKKFSPFSHSLGSSITYIKESKLYFVDMTRKQFIELYAKEFAREYGLEYKKVLGIVDKSLTNKYEEIKKTDKRYKEYLEYYKIK